MRKINDFTFIELLVALAIIVVLAAISFPVFGRGRENAQRSSCRSDLTQIGLAFIQSSQDYDERYPGIIGPDNVGTGRVQMDHVYTKSAQVFQCPSDRTIPQSCVTNPTTLGSPTTLAIAT